MSKIAQAWSLLLAACCGLLAVHGFAAGNDNNIEADGVWHGSFDVSPGAPQRNQPFTLELRTFRFDLTSASVRYYYGVNTGLVTMAWNRAEGNGTFDVWRATMPAIDSDFVYYRFEMRDGSAFAAFARSGFWGGDPPGGDFLLNLTALGAFPLGATVDGADTVFRVWAPNVEQAQVILNPDTGTPTYAPMSQVQGFWQVRVNGVGHEQRYKFRFFRNGGWLVRNDPRAKRLANSLAYSIVQRSAFAWEDQDWVIPDLEDSVIYEAHVGTFSGRGDGASGHPATYRDIADRHVAHMAEAGMNVLELMPVQEFPGDLSWGYNPAFLFAPESAYGTPEDFKYLVNKCHKAGIAVWVDVVLNHFDEPNLSGNLGWFNGDDIYFYSASSGYRDTGVGPRPDYGRVEVRDYLVDSIRHLIEEYHIDGFRFDHTAWVKVNADGWKLMKEISQMRSRVNPRVILTAEQWTNDSAVTRPVIWGGAGFDSQWSDPFHVNGRAVLNSLAYGDPSMPAMADAINHFGFSAREMINYIDNHDEARESPQYSYQGRVVQIADQNNPHSDYGHGRGKLFYGLTMFGAAVPLIFYGTEIATEIGFGDQPQHKIPWEYKQLYAPYFLACRDMTWLKRRSPALRTDSWQNVYHANDGANIIAWERARDGHYAIVVANFANNDWGDYWIGLPQGGTWYETINTAATKYGGSGNFQNGTIAAFNGPSGGMPYSAPLKLPRYSLVVLTKHQYDLTPRVDADKDGIDDLWELQHGLNPNLASDAGDDSDGDGLNSLAEFLYGTDPAIPNSPPCLALTLTGSGAQLTFPTVPNRYYEVEATSDLKDQPWQALATGISTKGQPSPAALQEVDPLALSTPQRFYRVKLRLDW